jgi:conjugal transfer ATP-binding protein TraC
MEKRSLRSLKLFSEYQAEYSLAQELPYWDFLENTVVLSDGTLVSGLKVQGIAIEALDADALNQITTGARAFLNNIPDGYETSFFVDVNSDFRAVIAAHEKLSSGKKDLDWLKETRLQLLRRQMETNGILKFNLYVFLYRRFVGDGKAAKTSFFSSPKEFQSVHKEIHDKAALELSQTLDGVHHSLSALGVVVEKITGEEIRALTYAFLNPNRSREASAPFQNHEHREQEFTPEELEKEPGLCLPSPREQLVFSDAVAGYDSFYLDGLYHRVISLKTMPEFTHSALMSRLMTLSFPHILQVHLRVPEQSKELSSLQAKRRMAHSMSISQGGRATDLESEAKLNSTEELLRELINTGQKIFYFQLTLLLRSESKDDLESNTREVLSKTREMNGAEAMAETVANFKVWKTMLQTGNLTAIRAKRVKTENLADFLPIYQPYEGAKSTTPVCLFHNRQGGLLRYDPFDSALPNYNTLVTGSSGAGKSFLNNLVLLQNLATKPLVYVIDIGGSYRKLCEFMDGQYIEITPPREGEKASAINPFLLRGGATEPPPQKIKFLLSLLENILTDEEGDKLHKLEKSLLEETVLKVYKDGNSSGTTPRLSDLAKVLSESKDTELRNFSRMLYPWTGDRPYGRVLDADNSLELEKEFVVFDLKGLSSYPDLQSAAILVITDFILGQVDSMKDRRKQILMDECWELLKSKGSSHFMEYCVRTLRKTGSGITFITQGLEEITASSIGSAILSNTATKFILQQRGDLEPTRKILKLNDQEMALIASLRSQKGRYSESFLIANDDRSVIRVVPTSVEYWLSTSDAADNQCLEEKRKKNPGKALSEIIFELSKELPFGVAGGGK